jgi:hypothetical protein
MTRRLALRKTFRQGKPMFSQDSADASPPPSLETALLAALGRAAGKTLSAPELAQEIAEEETDWHTLIMPIRRAAVKLALDGRLVIYRKGKPADPNDFRGVYRLGLPRHD